MQLARHIRDHHYPTAPSDEVGKALGIKRAVRQPRKFFLLHRTTAAAPYTPQFELHADAAISAGEVANAANLAVVDAAHKRVADVEADAFRSSLLDAASEPYRSAGSFAWHFARGKLGGDPAFTGLLERGLIPDGGRLLDLGCGQGLLASWLLAARAQFDVGNWPATWSAPPRLATIAGIELMSCDVERARAALGESAGFIAGDIRSTEFGRADAIVILDVLHYIGFAEQDAVLRRVRDALQPSGALLLRVGDAGAGWRFRWSNWVDHVVMFVRGHGYVRLCCRRVSDWREALGALGFRVEAIPMSAGTPFANVLLVATV